MNASVGTTAAVVKPTVASNHLTWFVVLPLFLFILLTATVNPQMAAAVTAVVLLLTTVYAAVSDRPTWARFTRRRETILPMIFSTIILTATLWLPTTPITNAQVFTDMPEISETQAQEIKTGWTTIDPRFEPMDPILLKGLAAGICRHDLEPRSPDQAVLDTQVTLRFEDGEPLTASQARAAVDVVRNVFCGQPGDRGAVLESELMFSPAGVWKWIQTLTS